MSLEMSVLASSSSGNSVYISNGEINILIDAGLSGKEITGRLEQCDVRGEDLDAILVTHEHNDHIKGVGIMSRRYDLPIYANELTWEESASALGKIKKKNIKTFSGNFMLGNMGIEPFSISHDARDPVGYIINCNKNRIGIATDMGYIPENVKNRLKNLDILLIEANHDLELLMSGSYPWKLKNRIKSKRGHLSNDAAAQVLPQLINGHKPQVLLGHLSQENNIPKLAYMTIENNLREYGLIPGEDLELDFAHKDRPTGLYRIG